ncbi:MAG: Crp/Fnr family transcriptional regulator [Deltaproteobacteria bacterium]|jgi:CRP-like cAMP-binding protein|nr:Crp/Fnr family transcriptional regulator [Deltaproteobacteria bacterium]
MKKYLPVLNKCKLFVGINSADLQALLGCLSAVQKNVEKNSFIFMEAEKVLSVGVVLSGSINIIREDFMGNRTILAHIGTGGLFGEAFSCAGVEKLPVSVISAEKSEILLLNCKKIITSCSSACSFHAVLIKNLVQILAQHNIMLTQKIEYLTRRNTREKLLAYLSAQAKQVNSHSFQIPFNRQELAEYLAVDRSAMSNELCKMRAEGIVNFRRNCFELLTV